MLHEHDYEVAPLNDDEIQNYDDEKNIRQWTNYLIKKRVDGQTKVKSSS